VQLDVVAQRAKVLLLHRTPHISVQELIISIAHSFPLSNRLYANGLACSCEPEEKGGDQQLR